MPKTKHVTSIKQKTVTMCLTMKQDVRDDLVYICDRTGGPSMVSVIRNLIMREADRLASAERPIITTAYEALTEQE